MSRHADARHRDQLRRNRRRHCWRRRRRIGAHPLQSGVFANGGASALWRHRAGDRGARPSRAARRVDCASSGRGPRRLRRSRRRRRDRRAGADRRRHRRRHGGEGDRVGPAPAVHRRQSSRRPRTDGAADRRGGVSVSAAAGVGRPLSVAGGGRRRPLSPSRHHARRRRRRGVRQGRQAAGPRLSRRAGGRSGGKGWQRQRGSHCRGR